MATLKEVHDKIREYWEYIDGSNVMEMFTNALSDLFNEPVKPPDIIQYIRDKLGDDSIPSSEVDKLKKQIAEANERLKILEERVAQARCEEKLKKERFNFYKEKKAKILRDEAALFAKWQGTED